MPEKKKRNMTAVRRWKTVRDAAKDYGWTDVAGDPLSVETLIGKLKDAALEEVASK